MSCINEGAVAENRWIEESPGTFDKCVALFEAAEFRTFRPYIGRFKGTGKPNG